MRKEKSRSEVTRRVVERVDVDPTRKKIKDRVRRVQEQMRSKDIAKIVTGALTDHFEDQDLSGIHRFEILFDIHV